MFSLIQGPFCIDFESKSGRLGVSKRGFCDECLAEALLLEITSIHNDGLGMFVVVF